MRHVSALRFAVLATAAAILMVGGAACGSTGGTTNTESTAASTRTMDVSAAASTPTPAPVTVRRRRSRQVQPVKVARTTYGRVLVDRRGFALYLFTHDRSADSTCYGACAAAWPPYVVAKRPRGGAHTLVGSVRRRDGRLQVTYAGHPLYYYVGDRHPQRGAVPGGIGIRGNVVRRRSRRASDPLSHAGELDCPSCRRRRRRHCSQQSSTPRTRGIGSVAARCLTVSPVPPEPSSS